MLKAHSFFQANRDGVAKPREFIELIGHFSRAIAATALMPRGLREGLVGEKKKKTGIADGGLAGAKRLAKRGAQTLRHRLSRPNREAIEMVPYQ
ncbi:MAG: hypothetical protein U1D55_09140 [Phycisphaerae bacterium]